MPEMIWSMWVAKDPGRTMIRSVSKAKHPCLVLIDFSFICLWMALTMLVTWDWSRLTGPSSASILLGSARLTPALGLVCFSNAW